MMNWVDLDGLWGIKISYYTGYGGSITFGKTNGHWFLREVAGVGLGAGISFNPGAGIPTCPCDEDGPRVFIGSSAWAGGSFLNFSAGISRYAGGTICQKDGKLYMQYVEGGGKYASASLKKGSPGIKLGGGVNLIDVGIRF